MSLLEDAGGIEGPIALWVNNGTGNESWVRMIGEQFEESLGIEVEIKSAFYGDYVQALEDGSVDGPYRMGWVMDYPSAQNYLEPLFGSGSKFNRSRYSNQKVDALIAQGNAAPDMAESVRFYQQAEDLILEDMPVIPLFFRQAGAAHADGVDDVRLDVFGRVRIVDVTLADSSGY